MGLMPFTATGMPWMELPTALPGKLGVGEFSWSSLLLSVPLGFAWLGAFWPRERSARLATAIPVLLGLLAQLLLLRAGQVLLAPTLAADSGLLFPTLGFACGILVWWLWGPLLASWLSPPSPSAWTALVVFAALTVLYPQDLSVHAGATLLPAGLTAYLTDIPQRGYLLIKSAMLWVPLAFLLALSGRTTLVRQWGMALFVAILLECLPLLSDRPMLELLELVFALPGLWVGAWLGEFTARRPVTAAAATVIIPAADAPASTTANAANPSPPATSAPSLRKRTSRARYSEHQRQRTHPLRLLLGALLLLGAGLALLDFPLWQVGIASGLASYILVLWLWPTAWLVAVPVALPLLDLAPWTGRFFVDGFDLFLLVTAGALLLRGHRWPNPRLLATWPLLMAWGISVAISGLLGLGAPPPLDANAFSNYWSAYNSLRVAKGFIWAGLLFMLLRLTRPAPAILANRLALGMGIGLLGVGLVGLWERWLFAGFADSGHTYRIVSTFSSMHTGGGHIEAYLAAALPFLWLGMRRWRTLPLAMSVMALTVYVMIFTVARGGVLAVGVILATLAVANLHLAWRSGQRRQAVIPTAVLALLAAGLLAGIGGSYFQQRLAQAGEDWTIRVDHWKQAITMMDASPMAQLFGMGLGSFPRVYLERGPVDKQPATFGFRVEKDNTFLRLGSGDTLYYAQRVAVRAGNRYHLELDARSNQEGARIEVPVCEKQLLNSRACVWIAFNVPSDGRWHRLSHDFSSGEVGIEEGLRRPPVELFLYNPGKANWLDVDNVRLLDATGDNLIGNGGFTWGGDYWFFKTHSHLPWHIKNVWVHVLFEQGWLGLALFTALVAFALTRLVMKARSGEPLAWVLLASLLGLLTVGMFDSLFDAPRLATLLTLLCLLGVAYDWDTTPQVPHRHKHRSRRSHHPDERPRPPAAPRPDKEYQDQASTPSAR